MPSNLKLKSTHGSCPLDSKITAFAAHNYIYVFGTAGDVIKLSTGPECIFLDYNNARTCRIIIGEKGFEQLKIASYTVGASSVHAYNENNTDEEASVYSSFSATEAGEGYIKSYSYTTNVYSNNQCPANIYIILSDALDTNEYDKMLISTTNGAEILNCENNTQGELVIPNNKQIEISVSNNSQVKSAIYISVKGANIPSSINPEINYVNF